ncbi:hypothetical protein EH220_07755, partial [bacterium]
MNTTVAEPAIYDKIADAGHLSGSGKIASAEPAIYDKVEDASLLQEYDDGAGWPNCTREKEQAFRQGFLEEA